MAALSIVRGISPATLPAILKSALRLLRSLRVNWPPPKSYYRGCSSAEVQTERLRVATILAVFKAFLGTANFATAHRLGERILESRAQLAFRFVEEQFGAIKQGTGYCFERMQSGPWSIVYGAFYLKKSPFDVACMVKFIAKGQRLLVAIADLTKEMFVRAVVSSEVCRIIGFETNLEQARQELIRAVPSALNLLGHAA